MDLIDVNVLVYAHREDAPAHSEFRSWLDARLASGEPVGVPELVFSGFLRIATHPKIFSPPTPFGVALAFVEGIRAGESVVPIRPGPRHWHIFTELCRATQARGNLVPDAYLAAMAIERGDEWVTTDRDFARFPGLRWRHPLE